MWSRISDWAYSLRQPGIVIMNCAIVLVNIAAFGMFFIGKVRYPGILTVSIFVTELCLFILIGLLCARYDHLAGSESSQS